MSARPSATAVCWATPAWKLTFGRASEPSAIFRISSSGSTPITRAVGRPDRRRDAGAAAEIDDQARPSGAGQLQQQVEQRGRRLGPVSVILSGEATPRVAGPTRVEQRVV